MVIKEREIKEAIQKRCQDFETNQRKMINSLTNQVKKSITIDRVLVKSEQPYISTDPQEVFWKTEKHYKETFKTRNSNFDLLNEKWKKEYAPRTGIKEA